MLASVCIWPPIPDTIQHLLVKWTFNCVRHLNDLFHSRKHKKGLEEDVTKKRTRRAQKFQRAVVGATLQARDLLGLP